MTETRSAQEPRPTRTLCLGDPLVDLICERPLARLADADSFTPHFGGVAANVAIVAARAGAEVALAGGAGDDDWGEWLRSRLLDEGVDVSSFALIAGRKTPLALVAVGVDGEATYYIYGELDHTLAHLTSATVDDAVRDSAALFFSSNTLVDADEREVTMRARAVALESDRPVIFDPNLRLHRWRSRADASASANACVPGALLVRANQVEAALMTGEDDAERAARAILKAGARMVVITLGRGGAILRGERRTEVTGVPVEVASTVGAGDVLTGFLLARLALSNFYPSAVAAGLHEAVARSAQACERWGALD